MALADEVADDGLVQALHRQRLRRRDLEQAAHVNVGVVADPQTSGRCGLLHTGGNVDGLAADARVVVNAAAEQHGAGVNAHAEIAAAIAVSTEHFGADGLAERE